MIDQSAALGDVLRAMRREMEQTLGPEIKSTLGNFTVLTFMQMLEQIAIWLSDNADADIDRERGRLIERLGGVKNSVQAGLNRDFEDHSGLGLALASLVTTRLPQVEEKQKFALIADIAAAELAILNRERAAVLAHTAGMTTLEVAVTAEVLDRYFAGSDEFKGCRTQSVREIPGGFSKNTYLVNLMDASGRDRDIVLRRDFPFGPTEYSAADEYGILLQLTDAGLAVPRPLAAVHDKTVLGQPFLVVERIEGVNAADLFDQDRPLAASVCLELAVVLGKLHALDPTALGLAAKNAAGPSVQIAKNLALWKAFWMRNRRTDSPLAEAAFAWLESNTPRDVERLVIVHGDARQHNVMVKDRRLTGLLDWEFAHAGDPAEDLEYTKIYVEPYVSWPAFIDAYLTAGGVPASESGSRYYEVFRALRNFICCDVSWAGFVTGKYPVTKLAVQGIVYRRDFLRWVGEALVRVCSS
jgi:aminoglycoside phosphotransferase (APT) family kinase protein